MRKLILLAAVVVLVALVLVLVSTLGARESAAPLTTDAPARATKHAPASLDSESGAKSQPIARESAAANETAATGGPSGSASLRIRVSFAHAPDHLPSGLEVRVSDLLGVQHDAHRESPLDFLVRGLAPGEFVVAASESKSIAKSVRARVAKDRGESTVDVELEPVTSLVIRWTTPSGRTIESAVLALPAGRDDPVLVVRASEQRLDPEGPPPERAQLAWVKRIVHMPSDPEAARQLRESGYGGRPPDEPLRPEGGAQFATLDVPAVAPFEVSAWIDGVMLDSQTVNAGQHEVLFDTSLARMAQSRVPVTCCFADGVTGAPVDNVRIWVSQNPADGRTTQTENGCGRLEADPGWMLLSFTDLAPAGRSEPSRYAPYAVEAHGIAGLPLDLGTIRLSPVRAARLRVVDASGKPVSANEITIVRLASYDGTQAPFDLQHEWSKEDGIVTFARECREKYVAASTAPRLDSVPIVFDGTFAADDEDTILGTIVLRPVRQISLVFDEPPRVGTLMMIETPDGLPVRTLELDEFGVVPLWLGGTDYRIHLVEDGLATPSVPLTIDSDPCIRHIKR